VKSVRKELKNHLLRILKHPGTFSNHHRLSQLLLDLGANQQEIQRSMPAPGEISDALKRKVAYAAQASSNMAAELLPGGGGALRRPIEDTDLRDVKRLKVFLLS
jgi:hypothetical protein